MSSALAARKAGGVSASTATVRFCALGLLPSSTVQGYTRTLKSGRQLASSAVSTRSYERCLHAVEMCAVRCPPAEKPANPILSGSPVVRSRGGCQVKRNWNNQGREASTFAQVRSRSHSQEYFAAFSRTMPIARCASCRGAAPKARPGRAGTRYFSTNACRPSSLKRRATSHPSL